MRTLLLALLLVATAGVRAAAQAPDRPFPFAGTVIRMAPALAARHDMESRIVVLNEGAPVVVVGREGFLYRIVYTTPQGQRIGLMEPRDIRIDPNAELPWTPSDTSRFTTRGFLETRAFGFGQADERDMTRGRNDVIVRQEAFAKPARWLQLAAGVDLRDNSHGQGESEWRIDIDDRGTLRPRLAVRRLSASFSSRRMTLDLGKQFLRWGRADILSPVDRFAPRDFLNVIDNEFLPVTGARLSVRAAGSTFEAIWQPRFTPSRVPLLNQRWTAIPPAAAGLTLVDHGSLFPNRGSWGARWSHVGRMEMALSVFDGFNHLPDIAAVVDEEQRRLHVTRTFPALRTYGGELYIPTSAFTIRSEAAYFRSPQATSDDYVLYVVEAERQSGEWLFTGGYTGEVVMTERAGASFAAERGVAKAIVGRAAYTIDPRRSIQMQAAVRQNGRGFYTKGEFSQTFGKYVRLTLTGVGIGGEDDDFLGRYRRNSHAAVTVRLSY